MLVPCTHACARLCNHKHIISPNMHASTQLHACLCTHGSLTLLYACDICFFSLSPSLSLALLLLSSHLVPGVVPAAWATAAASAKSMPAPARTASLPVTIGAVGLPSGVSAMLACVSSPLVFPYSLGCVAKWHHRSRGRFRFGRLCRACRIQSPRLFGTCEQARGSVVGHNRVFLCELFLVSWLQRRSKDPWAAPLLAHSRCPRSGRAGPSAICPGGHP